MAVSILDFIKAGVNPVEAYSAFRAAQRQAEAERRAKFGAFGIGEEVRWPSSALLHHDSKFDPAMTLPLTAEEGAALARRPDYKTYPGAARIALTADLPPLPVSLQDAIAARRSSKQYADAPIGFDALSRMLGSGCGITARGEVQRRAAPSAGALFPVETYVMVFAVDGLEPALYHYDNIEHQLEYVKAHRGWSDLRPTLDPGSDSVTPAVAFLLTARFERVQAKYGERGYRFAMLESGHIAQNFLLLGTALGLAVLPAGGFFDDGANHLLGVDGVAEAATYIIMAGKPAPATTKNGETK